MIFFWKIVSNWVHFGQGEDFKLTTELSKKVQYSRKHAGFSLEAGNRRTPAATFGISAAYFC